MDHLKAILRGLLLDRRGATAVEYGIIAALISMAMISGFGVFSGAISNMFNMLAGKIDTPVK